MKLPADSPQVNREQTEFGLQALGARQVVASFDGGQLSCDGGVLLLRDLDRSLGLTRSLAACFTDRRDQDRIEHSVQTLVGQRVLALALGYEDLNDHHALRHDPLLAAAQPSVPSVTTMGWAKPRADRRVAQASARFPDWQRM